MPCYMVREEVGQEGHGRWKTTWRFTIHVKKKNTTTTTTPSHISTEQMFNNSHFTSLLFPRGLDAGLCIYWFVWHSRLKATPFILSACIFRRQCNMTLTILNWVILRDQDWRCEDNRCRKLAAPYQSRGKQPDIHIAFLPKSCKRIRMPNISLSRIG